MSGGSSELMLRSAARRPFSHPRQRARKLVTVLARGHSVKRSAAAMVAKEVQAVATSSAATAESLWVADITYVAIAGGFVFSPRSWMPGHAGLSDTPSAAPSTPGSPSRRSTPRFVHGRLPRAACTTAIVVHKADSSGRRNTNCCSLMTAARQAPPPAFSSLVSFSVGH